VNLNLWSGCVDPLSAEEEVLTNKESRTGYRDEVYKTWLGQSIRFLLFQILGFDLWSFGKRKKVMDLIGLLECEPVPEIGLLAKQKVF
jgi:hypothetical protein